MINIQVSVNMSGLGTVKVWTIELQPDRDDCWFASNDIDHETLRANSLERIMGMIGDEILHKFV